MVMDLHYVLYVARVYLLKKEDFHIDHEGYFFLKIVLPGFYMLGYINELENTRYFSLMKGHCVRLILFLKNSVKFIGEVIWAWVLTKEGF